MNKLEWKKLTGRSINELAMLMNKQLTDIQLDVWTERFVEMNITPELVTIGCKRILSESDRKFFPTFQELIGRVTVSDDDLINKIRKAVKLFGWPNPEEARKYVGEIAWLAIKSKGGWNKFCSFEYKEMDFALRDMKPYIEEMLNSDMPELKGGNNGVGSKEIGKRYNPGTPKKLFVANSR